MAEASQLFSQKANDYRSGRTHYPKAIASILRELELPGNKQSTRMRHRYLFSDAFGLRLYCLWRRAQRRNALCSQRTTALFPICSHPIDSGSDSAARPFGGLYLCGTILPLV